MKRMNMLIVSGLVIFASQVAIGAEWGYASGIVPSQWEDYFPKCGKTRQSPVDITEEDVKDKDLGEINFFNYDGVLGMKLLNTGHSIKVSITSGVAEISGSGLQDDRYELAQFHFHQGKNSNRGAEHLRDGESFPAELHLVHFNKMHHDLGTAADKEPYGLAVLGIWIEVGKKDNPLFTDLISAMDSIRFPGNATTIPSIPLDEVLPKDLDEFYRYQGSLTTPPCYESVQWTVFKNTIKMSKYQLEKLRSAIDDFNMPMVDNFRPPQALNCRHIYCNDEKSKGESKSKSKSKGKGKGKGK